MMNEDAENLGKKLIDALTRDKPHQEILRTRPPQEEIDLFVAAVGEDAALLHPIIIALFDDDIPITADFFDRLAQVEYRLGHSPSVTRLIGSIWATAFARFPDEKRTLLLRAFTAPGLMSFFVGLRALAIFLENSILQAEVMAEWIVEVRRRLGNDASSHGFWNGLLTMVERFPTTTLRLIELMTQRQLDKDSADIAAFLLGHLRAVATHSEAVDRLSENLRTNRHTDKRLAYFRSWITTALRSHIKAEQFRELLNQMSCGTPEEVDEGFNYLRCLLPQNSTPEESLLFGLEWLHARTNSGVSDFWKHHTISLVRDLYPRWQKIGRNAAIASPSELIVKLFPIREEHAGTWYEFDQTLVFLFSHDRSEFVRLLFAIASTASNSLSNRLTTHSGLSGITSAMATGTGTEVIVEALLSDNGSVRHLGFSLFEATGIMELKDNRIACASDDRIAIILFSFQMELFHDEVIPRFLVALEPRASSGSEPLRKLFLKELLFQGVNLPGICLNVFKNRTEESDLAKLAVPEIEKYFDALRPCFHSAVNSMGIPGLDRAARMKAARHDREMRKQIDEKSVVSQFCSTSYTLYGGKRWQTFNAGQLGEVSEMKLISHSAEFPRMPSIDPEGLALRRHHANLAISTLLAKEQSTPRDDK